MIFPRTFFPVATPFADLFTGESAMAKPSPCKAFAWSSSKDSVHGDSVLRAVSANESKLQLAELKFICSPLTSRFNSIFRLWLKPTYRKNLLVGKSKIRQRFC